MELYYEKAAAQDAAQIAELFALGRRFLKEQGIDQWQGAHSPSLSVAEADIQKNLGRVLRTEDGRVAAYAALIPGIDPTYVEIDGAWRQNGVYETVHRLTTHPDFRRTGLARRLLAECQAEARAHGAQSLRIDTHADNKIMQHTILSSGFCYCGVITQPSGAKRNAYEAAL